MPYDGSGNFTIINNFEEDRINGVSIDSLKMDNNFNDIANGLSNVMLRSGSVVMTGILNMGDHKITNLVAGTSSKDAVNKGQMDTALSAKQATVTGGASTITSSNLTANRALVSSSSGKVAVSAVTATELGYLDGVTSAIQTQLNTKQTSADVSTAISNMLKTLFPVGSIYIGTQSTCPLATLISGSTWTKVSGDKVLQTSSSSHSANSTIAAGLPNIEGDLFSLSDYVKSGSTNKAFSKTSTSRTRGIGGGDNTEEWYQYKFSASGSSSIYGASTTVQPPAYVVNVWRRTA